MLSYKEQLRKMSRSELLRIFNDEIKLAEDFINEEAKKSAETCALLLKLKLLKSKLRDARRSRDIETAMKISGQLREMRREIKGKRIRCDLEALNRLSNLVNEYKVRLEAMTHDGFGTTQKVNDFLIEAIAGIRKAMSEVKTYEVNLSRKGTYSKTVGRFKRPWDWAGYREEKYSKCVGLDLDKIKCENCRHWDEEERKCLISGRRTRPDFRCLEFGRRGL
jgi:hypothetical protein